MTEKNPTKEQDETPTGSIDNMFPFKGPSHHVFENIICIDSLRFLGRRSEQMSRHDSAPACRTTAAAAAAAVAAVAAAAAAAAAVLTARPAARGGSSALERGVSFSHPQRLTRRVSVRQLTPADDARPLGIDARRTLTGAQQA